MMGVGPSPHFTDRHHLRIYVYVSSILSFFGKEDGQGPVGTSKDSKEREIKSGKKVSMQEACDTVELNTGRCIWRQG